MCGNSVVSCSHTVGRSFPELVASADVMAFESAMIILCYANTDR